jgi:hypothetical protein
MDQDFKVRENRARRAAQRRGWRLEKSRARDPHAIGYGLYLLVDATGAPQVKGDIYLSDLPYSSTLEQIEKALGIV